MAEEAALNSTGWGKRKQLLTGACQDVKVVLTVAIICNRKQKRLENELEISVSGLGDGFFFSTCIISCDFILKALGLTCPHLVICRCA